MTEKIEATKGQPASQTPVSLSCVYGRKTGMTRVFDAEGKAIAITVINLEEPTIVTQIKTKEKDGYDGLQLSFGTKKAQRVNKPEKGHFQKSGHAGFYFTEEVRLDKPESTAAVGGFVNTEFLKDGLEIDLQGTTKGKGFQGVMKVWNFGGQPASHGHSVSHRSPGSIGNRADPGRVFPGHKMAKHMGMDKQTTQNLKVHSFDPERKLLLVEGAVPGAKSWIVRITKAVKTKTKSQKTK